MDKKSRPLLSSIETEYAIFAVDKQGQRVNSEKVSNAFMETARDNYAFMMCASSSGIFLANGARLYIDAGGHPEYAGPECAGHPNELVAHVNAGHAIVANIAQHMEQDERFAAVRVWRGNIDYTTKASWGCHQKRFKRPQN